MYPNSFYKMKNFANPKTMFKSCVNNDEQFSTEPVVPSTNGTRMVRSSSIRGGPKSGSPQNAQNCFGAGYPSATSTPETSTSRHKNLHSTSSYTNTANGSGNGSGAISGSGSNGGNIGFGSLAGSEDSISRSHSACSNADDVPSTSMACGVGAGVPMTDFYGNASGEQPAEQQEPAEPHHPLHSNWTLWYLENDRSKSWEDMLHEVTSFNTVENFWSLINHIKPPSEIKLGSDYCLFKKGIRPMWEDDANVHGGRWVINLNKSTQNDLDHFWLDTMLCLIGECCDYSDELCGAVVNIRGKSNKISIWTADGGNEAAALEIGNKLRESLRMETGYVLQYQLHKDTMVKQGSAVKSIYTL
ncbi:eukaryotic translation initiation factor 4E1 [Drosophila tropicalis]|uniref:eukaryotic translation initiation factor 4E1 n=1 Tax=Drosophila tropicalis TaxID=46794 RepID=UPI0035AC0E63